MELLVACVEALGNIVAPVAWAFAAVMIVAVVMIVAATTAAANC